jgi:hypothetical protein
MGSRLLRGHLLLVVKVVEHLELFHSLASARRWGHVRLGFERGLVALA